MAVKAHDVTFLELRVTGNPFKGVWCHSVRTVAIFLESYSTTLPETSPALQVSAV